MKHKHLSALIAFILLLSFVLSLSACKKESSEVVYPYYESTPMPTMSMESGKQRGQSLIERMYGKETPVPTTESVTPLPSGAVSVTTPAPTSTPLPNTKHNTPSVSTTPRPSSTTPANNAATPAGLIVATPAPTNTVPTPAPTIVPAITPRPDLAGIPDNEYLRFLPEPKVVLPIISYKLTEHGLTVYYEEMSRDSFNLYIEWMNDNGFNINRKIEVTGGGNVIYSVVHTEGYRAMFMLRIFNNTLVCSELTIYSNDLHFELRG